MHDFEVLQLLLKAKSKDFVLKVCNEAVNEDHAASVLEIITSTLECSPDETLSLIRSLNSIITAMIQKNISEADMIVGIFPENFHKSLANLLTKIFVEMLPFWRNQLLDSVVSPPKLASFSWSVSTEQEKDAPLCFLNMNIKEEDGQVRSVNAHLGKESLTSLLSGLKKIKNQINTLTTS